MRINRFLASCNLGSRRSVEKLIRDGKVFVNGTKVVDLSFQVSPTDKVFCNGSLLKQHKRKIYIAINKPPHYIVSAKDELGRATLADLLPDFGTRVFPVGRLDKMSTGLIFFTNDGDFANRILHPNHKFPKLYKVKIKGRVGNEIVDRLRNGVKIDGEKTLPCKVFVKSRNSASTLLKIELAQGRKRQIRKMLKLFGFDVFGLKRLQIGCVKLVSLPAGEWRYLKKWEIAFFNKDNPH